MFNHLSKFYWQLFKNDYLRFLLVYFRYMYFKFNYRFKEIQSLHSIPNTNSHNREALKKISTECFYNRIRYLHGVLMSLEYINKDANILLIGSRTENELIYLKSYGFKKITCIDLLSYAPTIQAMDMHKLEFNNDKFDVVICGWTLVYSYDEKKCAEEILRVSKNNAVIAIGYAKRDLKIEKKTKILKGSLVVPIKNANSADQILNLFKNKIRKIIFIYDGELSHLTEKKINKISNHSSSNILTVFKIKK